MIPLRLARELTFQLEKAEEFERLAKTLAEIPIFLVMYNSEANIEILKIWQRISEANFLPELHYQKTLSSLRRSLSKLLPTSLIGLQAFFESRGLWTYAIELLEELLNYASANDNPSYAMKAHYSLANIMAAQGKHSDARKHLKETVTLSRFLGDKIVEAKTIGILGVIFHRQGQLKQALRCYKKRLAIATSNNDQSGRATMLVSIGMICRNFGRYSEAQNYLIEGLEVSKKLGNDKLMLTALGNLGNLLSEQKRNEEALVYFEEMYSTSSLIGNKYTSSVALGGIGNIQYDLGKFKKALESYNTALHISEALGEKEAISTNIGNIGGVYFSLGQYSEALKFFQHQLQISDEIGDTEGKSIALGSIGNILLTEGKYEPALNTFNEALTLDRETGQILGSLLRNQSIIQTLIESGSTDFSKIQQMCEESIRISQEIKQPANLFQSRVLFARCEASEGKISLAIEKLQSMLDETINEEQLADLHYWLWKITSEDEHKNEALNKYISLLAHIPKFEFRKRIAELKGERIPLSADDLEEVPA